MEEFNSLKARFQNLYCNCYAVYKLSVKDGKNEFIYNTDYETEKEAIDYVERLCNLTTSDKNDFLVLAVKKNACGEIFINDTDITSNHLLAVDLIIRHA